MTIGPAPMIITLFMSVRLGMLDSRFSFAYLYFGAQMPGKHEKPASLSHSTNFVLSRCSSHSPCRAWMPGLRRRVRTCAGLADSAKAQGRAFAEIILGHHPAAAALGCPVRAAMARTKR